MSFGSIGAGFLAGVLSILSPCVLPLLPLVLGAATSAHKAGAAALALGLALAFTAAGLFVASIGYAVGLDADIVRTGSAILLGLIGIVLISKTLQDRLALVTGGASNSGHRFLQGLRPSGISGQFVIGAVLGLVWSPCVGPTLGAASLLASQGKNLGSVATVMLAFGLGSALPLLAVASLSRQAMARWRGRLLSVGQTGKLLLGLSVMTVAGLILTGADRTVETALVNASPAWLTDLTTRF